MLQNIPLELILNLFPDWIPRILQPQRGRSHRTFVDGQLVKTRVLN